MQVSSSKKKIDLIFSDYTLIEICKMPDYENCCVYKIISKDINIPEVYVGHTTNFNERELHHLMNCRNPSKKCQTKLYNFIRANGGWDNFEMIKIEDFPCSSKREAEAREQFWITELKSNLNKNKSFMEDNSGYHRDWYYANWEKRNAQIREWTIANADKVKEYRKKWRQDNKDKINAKRRMRRAQKKLEMQGQ
jgi:hypothetical protein